MTTPARQELHRGSFKGITFLYREVTESGEIKHIVHEYPNSDKQLIEVLGLRPSPFTIQIVLSGNSDLEKKRELTSAFKNGEKGIFVHPVDGPINNMVATSWRPKESDSQVGVTIMEVTFKPSGTTGIPKKTTNQKSAIEKQADKTENEIASSVDKEFEISKESPSNFEAGKTKLDGVVDSFKNVAKDFTVSAGETLDKYNASVNEFNAGINGYLNDPEGLGPAIKDIMVKVAPLIEDKNDATKALATFYNFGSGDVEIIPTTATLIERKKNNDTINTAMQGLALSEAYFAATDTEFTTVQDVEEEESSLEAAYQSIKNESGKGNIS